MTISEIITMVAEKTGRVVTGDRLARAILSGIIEPGDTQAGAMAHALGAEGMIDWISAPSLEEAGESQAIRQRLHERLADFDVVAELAELERLDGYLVTPEDAQWPMRLDELEDAAPFALWVRGNLPDQADLAVAITGSRAATTYGTRIAADFGAELAAQDLTIISGGAYGIDAAAHRGALGADNPGDKCRTVAVLCGGLSHLYPSGNTELLERIVSSGGALVTEMPPSARPARWRFLERNRIIAALSDITVVVESTPRGGAIAIAHKANAMGREVGAVPGPITSMSSLGCHQLIDEGAAIITGVEAVTNLLGIPLT